MFDYNSLPYEIIDAHIHPAIMVENSDISLFSFTNPPEKLVATLKRAGISKAAGSVVRRFPEPPTWDDIHQLNLAALEMRRQFPDFYIPGIHVHPDFPELSLEELKKHKEKGGVLVGELVYYMMGFQYSHPNFPELLHSARDLGMVVNFHPSKNMALNRIVTESAPGLVTVIAHLDGYGLYEDFIELMMKNECVCADLSAYGADRPGMLRDAVKRVGSERILYGTDFPGTTNGEMQSKYTAYVLSEALSDADTENILSLNAKRLLQLA